jgi:hypothetical protein
MFLSLILEQKENKARGEKFTITAMRHIPQVAFAIAISRHACRCRGLPFPHRAP